MLRGTRCLARSGTLWRNLHNVSRIQARNASFRTATNAQPATNEAFANLLYEQEMRQQWSRYRTSRYIRIFGRFAWFALGYVGLGIWMEMQMQDPEDFHMEISPDVSPVPVSQESESEYVYQTLSSPDLIFQPGTFRSKTSIPGADEWFAFPWLGDYLSGWPTVAHGGAIATLLSDTMGQAARSLFPEDSILPEPSSMRIDYVQTANTNARVGIFIRRHHYTSEEDFVSIPSPSWGRMTDTRPPPLDADRITPRLFLAASVFSVDSGRLIATALASFDVPETYRDAAVALDDGVSKSNSSAKTVEEFTLEKKLATFGRRLTSPVAIPKIEND